MKTVGARPLGFAYAKAGLSIAGQVNSQVVRQRI